MNLAFALPLLPNAAGFLALPILSFLSRLGLHIAVILSAVASLAITFSYYRLALHNATKFLAWGWT